MIVYVDLTNQHRKVKHLVFLLFHIIYIIFAVGGGRMSAFGWRTFLTYA